MPVNMVENVGFNILTSHLDIKGTFILIKILICHYCDKIFIYYKATLI